MWCWTSQKWLIKPSSLEAGFIRDWPVDKLKGVKVADALKHPNWYMGKKITVDSVTLFNKGLEVIEAHFLFGAEYDDVETVIHPQSIIHSMIETQHRIRPYWHNWGGLTCALGTFKAPDNVKYPSMDLAYAAGRAGGTMTGVLSSANEKAVDVFINERISYLDIFKVVELTCDKHRSELVSSPSLEEIIHYDLWAGDYASSFQPLAGFCPALV